MRFSTKQPQFYCGIDLHARSMSVCLLPQTGEVLVHRHMKASPDTFLQAGAPSRDDIGLAVACMFTWSWLADLCPQEGIPFVLGPALSMQAIHGGKAQNDKSDAPKIAVVLRGGMLPPAYGSPADMRATRDLLRRRMSLMRKRAALLTHIQHTPSPYTLPELGKIIAYQAHREGVAERFPAPALQKSLAVALARIGHYAPLRRPVELAIRNTAQQAHAQTLSLLRTVPGIGASLRRVRLYDIHESDRVPRVHDVVA
jgi:transposase